MRSQMADRLASKISEWLHAYVSGAELKHVIFLHIIQFAESRGFKSKRKNKRNFGYLSA